MKTKTSWAPSVAVVVAFGLVPRFAANAQPGKGGVFLAAPPMPFSLSTSDGQGLTMVSLSANVVLEDPLAFTELRLVFHNPEAREREGRFRITLPPGAALSRFALWMGDRWQEGEVVEHQAARVAYEQALHRRRDPALLETDGGNDFSVRVFPIPPNADKQLIVSYSEELPRSGAPYRLPLRGLPRIGSVTVHVTGEKASPEATDFTREGWVPDRDFEIAARKIGRLGVRHQNLVVARVVPFAGEERPQPIERLLVLVDTSASLAARFEDELARVQALLAELGRRDDPEVAVVAFDQETAPIFAGRAHGFGPAAIAALRAREALGASNLDAALAFAAQARYRRVLLVTDGVATAGAIEGNDLRRRVKALAAAGVQRLDLLATGGVEDQARQALLVAAGLPSDGAVLGAKLPVGEIVDRLAHGTRSRLTLAVPGARWSWPTTLDGVQPHDEVLIYADLPARVPFQVTVDGRPLSSAQGTLADAEGPLLERALARARIAQLLAQRDRVPAESARAQALQQEVTALSVRQRVVSPFTALVVLETDDDYARFGITRRAHADILTVGETGLSVLARRLPAPGAARWVTPGWPSIAAAPPAAAARAPVVEEPRGVRESHVEEVSIVERAPTVSTTTASVRQAYDLDFVVSAPHDPRDTIHFRSMNESVEEVSVSRQGSSMWSWLRRLFTPKPHPSTPASAPARRPVPVTEPFDQVLALLARGRGVEALAQATDWHRRDPADVLALVALGRALEASGDPGRAARAYGSLIDLSPGRAELRRFAGENLEPLGQPAARDLAIDTFRKAAADRPDHPSSHRLLAFALLRAGRLSEAFSVLEAAVTRSYPDGRFRGVDRVLREDLGLVAAAWIRAEPRRAGEIRDRLSRSGGLTEDQPSLRFVLTWETDASDVDLHVWDGGNEHAYFREPQLASGGSLYADVTTGYGPECFTVREAPEGRAYPYVLRAQYFGRGPTGHGIGKLEIIDHDGHGNLRFDERPFVVMQEHAFVDLGTVGTPVVVRAALPSPADSRPTHP